MANAGKQPLSVVMVKLLDSFLFVMNIYDFKNNVKGAVA